MRAALFVLFAATTAHAGDLRLVAHAFDGEKRHDSLAIVVREGVIVSTEDIDETPAAGFLTPGLWDLDSRLGLQAGDAEVQEALSPDLRLADAFAPDDAEAAALRTSGVSSAWLLGGDTVVLAGASAIVEPSAAAPRVRLAPWGGSGSLSSSARLDERAPTSLPDQAAALREARGSMPGPLRVRFDDGASIRAAAKLGLPVGLPPRAEDLEELRPAPGLVASADWAAVRSDQLAILVEWMKGGGALALGSGPSTMGPVAVRLAAQRLIEEGADRDSILRSLTSVAARLAGQPERGVLRAGAPADMVLWSGDPTSLASRPLRIWVRGEEILRAP